MFIFPFVSAGFATLILLAVGLEVWRAHRRVRTEPEADTMTDHRGLKAIGWAFCAATVVVFVVATTLVGQTAASGRNSPDAGYGTEAMVTPISLR